MDVNKVIYIKKDKCVIIENDDMFQIVCDGKYVKVCDINKSTNKPKIYKNSNEFSEEYVENLFKGL